MRSLWANTQAAGRGSGRGTEGKRDKLSVKDRPKKMENCAKCKGKVREGEKLKRRA